MRHRERRAWLAAGVLAISATVITAAGPALSQPGTDWTGYLYSPAHGSDNAADTAITVATAGALKLKWKHTGKVLASPTVAGGAEYIGTTKGYFEMINEMTGTIEHKYFIGVQPKKTCPADGVVSTATVSGGDVYVAGPDGYLYAFTASNLKLAWRSLIAKPSATVSNYFNWSSPTVANGMIYIGISSHCDNPLVRGGEDAFSAATGKKVGTFYTVPSGSVGGSIWSSAAVDAAGNVYVTTGNPKRSTNSAYTEAIVKLSADLKTVEGVWQVPPADVSHDGDFGGSPTLFGNDVGACNKDGVYFAVNAATMTLDWRYRVSAPATGSLGCLAAAAWNGQDLYLAGNATMIAGKAYDGSVRELTPAGVVVWQTGLPDAVDGSVTLNGSDVLGAGTYQFPAGQAPDATFLLNAATGNILATLEPGHTVFGQSVFANGMLFTANSGGIEAWAP